MSISSKRYLIPLIIGIVALAYYTLLCAKGYTWVFVSGDSGDWLATANWWMVPQPYGSPLWIALCRLFGMIPGNQAFNITFILSVVPATVTVVLTYLITYKITSKRLVSVVASVVLLGSTVLLTQATVLEQYMLSTMLLTLAFYLRIHNHSRLTVLALGLGAAVHITVLLIGIFWLAADLKYWRQRVSNILIAIVVVGSSYVSILVLMGMDTPKLLAGGLTYESVRNYLSVVGGNVVGQLSIFEFPQRLWDFSRIMLVSLGVAIVPAVVAIRHPVPYIKLALLGTVFAAVGYYLTCLDYTTWTFLTFAMPSVAILSGIGLSKLKPYHAVAVTVCSLCLIVLNAVFMNASVLTSQNPIAQQYYDDLQDLPERSVVATNASFYSLGMFYAMSEGKQLIPVIYPYLPPWKFDDYVSWVNKTYGTDIPDDVTEVEVVEYFLQRDYDVYFAYYPERVAETWDELVLEGTGDIRKVVGVRQ